MKFTQEQESISKIADKLKTKLERLEEIISEREDYASEKSEKWLESSTGEAYQEKTEQLDDTCSTVQNIVDELEDLASQLEELQ